MQTMRKCAIAVIFVASCALSVTAQASSATTDVSDIWWVPSESGWGMQLVQNNNFVFATLYIYGSDGTPRWLTGQLNGVGGFTWSGPLYATTGPSFASPVYDPSIVGYQQVGTMTFHLTDIADGVLTYTVNGISITKSVTRETLVNEDLSGSYDVVGTQTQTCLPPLSSGKGVGLGSLSVSQVGTNITGEFVGPGGTCTIVGTYVQTGKLGAVNGTYSCSTGEVGTLHLYEITVTETGIIARLSEQSNFCSSIVGQWAGNRD